MEQIEDCPFCGEFGYVQKSEDKGGRFGVVTVWNLENPEVIV